MGLKEILENLLETLEFNFKNKNTLFSLSYEEGIILQYILISLPHSKTPDNLISFNSNSLINEIQRVLKIIKENEVVDILSGINEFYS